MSLNNNKSRVMCVALGLSVLLVCLAAVMAAEESKYRTWVMQGAGRTWKYEARLHSRASDYVVLKDRSGRSILASTSTLSDGDLAYLGLSRPAAHPPPKKEPSSTGAASDKKSDVTKAGSYEIKARVESGFDDAGRAIVKITNESSWLWERITVSLNDGLIKQGFFIEIPKLQPGVSRQWPLSEFAKKDGARFKPEDIRLRTVQIHCWSPAGHLESEGWNIR